MKLERRARREVRRNAIGDLGALALVIVGAFAFLVLSLLGFIGFLVSPEK